MIRTDPIGTDWTHPTNIQSTALAHDIYVMNLGFHILDPEYRFPADWYYNNVLHLWTWSLGKLFGESDNYAEYRRGCVGLCNIRLGLPYMDFPYKSAKGIFKDFDSAMQCAKGQTVPSGKKVRIFAMLFDKILVTEDKWKSIDGEIPNFAAIVDQAGGFDFLTLHQPKTGQSSWFWESMTESLPNGKVLHRPFVWVLPENLEDKTHYNYIVFCVVIVNDTSLLPPAQTYGN